MELEAYPWVSSNPPELESFLGIPFLNIPLLDLPRQLSGSPAFVRHPLLAPRDPERPGPDAVPCGSLLLRGAPWGARAGSDGEASRVLACISSGLPCGRAEQPAASGTQRETGQEQIKWKSEGGGF